jgi:hypothetical protein
MIKHIRSYIDLHINSLDKSFVAHKQANTSEGIAATKYDKTYWIEFAGLPITYDGTYYQDSFDVNLEISAKGGRDPIKSHDDLWCFALRLRDILVKRSNIKQGDFQNVTVNSINPIAILSNDNWSKLQLNITIILTNKIS